MFGFPKSDHLNRFVPGQLRAGCEISLEIRSYPKRIPSAGRAFASPSGSSAQSSNGECPTPSIASFNMSPIPVTFILANRKMIIAPFERLNKTNQFNLKRNRLTDSSWAPILTTATFLMPVIYEDKYGPLG